MAYDDIEKKKEERFFLDLFLSKVGLQYEIESDEAPDFRLKSHSGITGLEVTRLFHPPDKTGMRRRAVESLRESVIERARTMYEETKGPVIHVSVFFNSFKKLTKQRVSSLAGELKDLVIRNLPLPDSNTTEEYEWTNRAWFPEEINRLSIWRIAALTNSHWYAPDTEYIPHCTVEAIQEVISKKAGRIAAYQRQVKECWLLLVFDDFKLSGMFQLPQSVVSHTYQSPFSRIYLLRAFNGEVVRLSTN